MQKRIVVVLSLSVAVLSMALIGLLLPMAPKDISRERVVELDVKSFKFAFEPGTNSPIIVEKGSLLVLHVTSLDVTHGFGLIEYGVNKETPPSQTVEIRFVADKVGEFTFFCTVFCGTGHPDHKGKVIVEE